jgi:hypothetical protein
MTFGLVQNGSNWDVVITGGSVGGDDLANGYSIKYQMSGDNTVGGLRGPTGLNSPLTADGSQYGQRVAVQALACRTYDGAEVCQPSLSGVFNTGYVPVNPSIGNLTFTSTGLTTGTFDWLSWPKGPGYEGVQYICDGQPLETGNVDAPGRCDSTSLLLFHLTIRVIANNGQPYDIQYTN